ncbi:GNAT family N-acetyltransferase [Curvivirga sp.]|uniref:GNAT family N-acetyltransferase n=1 Tax=Curvivirga sp. TaxID=2856848 RepID=UPI003B5C73F9
MMIQKKDLGTSISKNKWPNPDRLVFNGRYMHLEPLRPEHGQLLWPSVTEAEESFDYLRYGPFADVNDLTELLDDLSNRADQPFWLVTPKGSEPLGWLSICDIYQQDSSIEIGSIWFSPKLQGSAASREAIFTLMKYVMDDLGYERLVWRCHAQNKNSFKAALNLGFTHEGNWRNAAIVKGWQRDIAWFSILKSEWLITKDKIEKWLAPDNFDPTGRQIKRLNEIK